MLLLFRPGCGASCIATAVLKPKSLEISPLPIPLQREHYNPKGSFQGCIFQYPAERAVSCKSQEHDFREVVDPVLRRYVAQNQDQRVMA